MTNQEYNLTIMDIDWEDGNLYETKSGEKFLVLHNALTHYDAPNFNITDAYLLKDILNKKFRKIIDWSKVPIDTKILVGGRYHELEKRHFAKYEDGKIYAWQNGWTSWTVPSSGDCTSAWDFAKLVEEE